MFLFLAVIVNPDRIQSKRRGTRFRKVLISKAWRYAEGSAPGLIHLWNVNLCLISNSKLTDDVNESIVKHKSERRMEMDITEQRRPPEIIQSALSDDRLQVCWKPSFLRNEIRPNIIIFDENVRSLWCYVCRSYSRLLLERRAW